MDRDGPVRCVQMRCPAGIDLAAHLPRDFGPDVQCGAHWHGTPIVNLQMHRHHRHGQQTVENSHGLVHRRRDDTPVGEAGRSLVVVAYLERAQHGHALTRGGSQMESCRMVNTAPQTPAIVTRDGIPGSWRTLCPHRYLGVRWRMDATRPRSRCCAAGCFTAHGGTLSTRPHLGDCSHGHDITGRLV